MHKFKCLFIIIFFIKIGETFYIVHTNHILISYT